METQFRVSIVDDDDSVRESLSALLRSAGYDVDVFRSAEDYLDAPAREHEGCLILDVCMPSMSGPECHRELLERGSVLPVIYISARADAPLQSQALARGAIAYLTKPFSEDELLEALGKALS